VDALDGTGAGGRGDEVNGSERAGIRTVGRLTFYLLAFFFLLLSGKPAEGGRPASAFRSAMRTLHSA
jgi:hypothetical protein